MKRHADIQLNNVTQQVEEDEEETVFKQADNQVLKKREIKMPKSRLKQFGGVGQKQNSSVSGGIPVPTGKATKKSDDGNPSTTQYALRLRSLNKSFLKKITAAIESNENIDISSLCTQYVKYRSQIKKPGQAAPLAPSVLPNATQLPSTTSSSSGSGFQFGSLTTTAAAQTPVGSLPSPAADTQPPVFNAPTSAVPPSIPTPAQPSFGSIPSAGLSFGGSAKQNDDSKPNFQFGSAQKSAESTKPSFQFGSTPKPEESATPKFQFGKPKPSEPAKPNFQFGSTAKPEEGIDKTGSPFGSKEQDKKSDLSAKPTFQFGLTPKPSQEVSKPVFQFGTATKSAEEQAKPFQFATVNPAEEQPKLNFQFGGSTKSAEEQEKPTFQFGQTPKSTESKPTFQFGSTPSFGTPASKVDEKPLNPAAKPFEFKFGSSNVASTEVKPASTGFGFGAAPKSDTSTGFNFESTPKPVDSATKPAESSPSLLPKPSGFSFGGSSGFGNVAPSNQAQAIGTKSPGVAPTPSPRFSFGTPATGGEKKPPVSFGLQNLPTPAPLSTGFSFQPQTAPPVAEEGGEEESMPVLPQADLSKGAGEENDTTLFEVKAKIFTKKEKSWEVYGLGQLKLNKSEETTRLICRSDTGKLLVNCRLFANMTASAMGKSDLSLLMQIDDRVQPCLVRVKTPASRDELVEALNNAIATLAE